MICGTGMEDNESHLKLECTWDKSNLLLESPPPDADTRLKICLVKGDTRYENMKFYFMINYYVCYNLCKKT